MKSIRRRVRIQLGLRSIFVATAFVALLLYFVIAPDLRRAAAFERLREQGVVIHAPMVVMFGGQQPIPHVTPEPKWLAFRQRFNSLIGISTVPWFPDGYLEVPPHKVDDVSILLNDLGDLKAMRKWVQPEWPDIKFPELK
jgi:hypothetical protein